MDRRFATTAMAVDPGSLPNPLNSAPRLSPVGLNWEWIPWSIQHIDFQKEKQVAESTLERWRSEGIGPIYMKMMGRVRYGLSDITDFEEDSLRGSTSQHASARSDR